MSAIIDIVAKEILDSRGNPTVQVNVWTELGSEGEARVPSGASTGSKEAVELRDGDKKRYLGKGVLNAVNNVNEVIAEELMGYEVTEQELIDKKMIELDGTPNKAKLGANAILGVSMAVARAAANELELPLYKYLGGTGAKQLPVPCLNIINGGEHADNTVDFQEFMLVPLGFKTFRRSIQTGSEVFHALKGILSEMGLQTAVGDEGGFAPNLKNNEEALKVIVKAIEKAGYKPGVDVFIAMDCAANSFYNAKTKKYDFTGESKASGKEIVRSTEELSEYLQTLVEKYPVISVEDPFDESDWNGFIKFTEAVGHKIQVVGDDIFVTNPKIVARGIKEKAANAVLIKLNQIGTVSETLETIRIAHSAGWHCMVSHRSGETIDTTIADLVVSTNIGQIKSGSMSRSERISKYNRLMEIEDELEGVSVYKQKESFF